ncbi:MAG: right-handed parallel beta-helix repeat-containing protein [Candidatus Bathyarchaeota archaeon]|nr:right-handed parallel beta-helix repeat-containing protein [Candidatus Bathyarchaeota archaeon]
MDKLLFRRVLLLSLCVFSVTVSIIMTVEANGIIYIRANGIVDGTNKIQRNGNVYTFTDDIFDSIVVEKDGVMVDGAGYSLQGTGIRAGINLMERTNVTVKNIEVSGFFYGIYLNASLNNSISSNNVRGNYCGVYLSASSNNTIISSNITENESSGVWFRGSSNNEIRENRIIENGQDGIWLSTSSDDNKVLGNTVRTNGYGIRLDDYSNNMLRNNDLRDNGFNFGVFGSLLPEFPQDIDESNIVNGKPIYYWVNRQDMTVPLDAGYVALVNCSGITIKNLNLNNNGQGILLAYTTESSIIQNNITNNIHGIYLCGSSNNTVTGNNITKNALNGIYLYYSQNNRFFHNNFISNINQVYDVGAPSNIWDSGAEGNHWSNYVDKYPDATELDSSGIWNTPYVLDGNNQDNYPLVNEIPEFPSWIILPLFLVATLLIIICKQRLPKTPSN